MNNQEKAIEFNMKRMAYHEERLKLAKQGLLPTDDLDRAIADEIQATTNFKSSIEILRKS